MATKSVKIGWSENMVIEALGYPDDINTSQGIWGIHKQYIYEHVYSNEYYYFENGILTSMQY